MHDMHLRLVGLLPLLMTISLGCGSGNKVAHREKTVTVSGVVTLNNSPVEGATVTFDPGPASSTKAAFGVTDAAGKYSLTTYELNDGAMPGEYFVTITKQAAAQRTPDPANEEQDYRPPEETEGEKPAQTVPMVPPKYARSATSGLKADVKDQNGQTFDFKLTF